MGQKIKDALALIGVLAITAAILAALALLFKGEPPLIILPVDRTCTSDGQCMIDAGACADCVGCQENLHRCVYKLADGANCQCVEGERMPCESALIPGFKTCVSTEPNTAAWGPCVIFK